MGEWGKEDIDQWGGWVGGTYPGAVSLEDERGAPEPMEVLKDRFSKAFAGVFFFSFH